MKKLFIIILLITGIIFTLIKVIYPDPEPSLQKNLVLSAIHLGAKTYPEDKPYVPPPFPDFPLSEGDAKKPLGSPNIGSPDTEWQWREFDFKGKKILYEFGKGNPPEVALSNEELEKFRKETGGYSEKSGYVTPEAEMAMKRFLDNPSLPDFVNKCYKELGWYAQSNSQTYPHNLDMEYLMYVDPNTGLKRFRYNETVAIEKGFLALSNPLADEADQPWRGCLTSEEKTYMLDVLQNQFSDAMSEYIHLEN